MAVGGVGSIAAFQAPVTQQAKLAEELAEPAATKAKEAGTSNDSPIVSAAQSSKIVDIKV